MYYSSLRKFIERLEIEKELIRVQEKVSPILEIAEITRIPSNTVAVDEKKGKALLKLMDILDDHDDIQKAYSNFDISDDVMNAILEGN